MFTEGDEESVYSHFFLCQVPIIERMGFGADISVRRVVKNESKGNMCGIFTNPNVTCMGCSKCREKVVLSLRMNRLKL